MDVIAAQTAASSSHSIASTPLQPAGGQANSASGSAFGTILDAINPLQHIPIVSSLFRSVSGSSISAVSQLAGDTLYGGLLGGAISGFVSSLADVAVKGVTGKDIGEHVLATVEGTGQTGATALKVRPITVAPVADDGLKEKADTATALILRTGNHPERVAAKYKRAQVLSSTDSILAKAL